HTFAAAGSYFVILSGSDGHSTLTKTRPFAIEGAAFAVDFTTSATCDRQFGIEVCSAPTGTMINFSAVSANATSFTWNFGDGSPNGTGASVHHTYAAPGSYTVTLTGTDGTSTGIVNRGFQIEGAPVPDRRSVLIPWIGQNGAPGPQTSDIYLFNPAAE